jgi:hypothetical protein
MSRRRKFHFETFFDDLPADVYSPATSFRVLRARMDAYNRGLPHTLTQEDWSLALAYFEMRCAVCGTAFTGRRVFATLDHWIPLTKGGGSTATNILPLCAIKHSSDGCNDRKGDKLPGDWLAEQFGEAEVAAILARIEGYFAWVRGER